MKRTKIKLLSYITLAFVYASISTLQVFALGFETPQEISNRQKAHFGISFTGGDESEVQCSENPTSSSSGSLDGFLKALADQESGGDPKAEAAGSSASGKYQYLDLTWTSRKDMYPPSGDYARASDAPETVQDAVAYIEYSKKFTEFNQDIFKLALSHFYPAALSDPTKLDALIGSNSITPREYAESMVLKVREGVGADIPLLYADAPEFAKYATVTPTSTPAATQTPAQTKGIIFLDPGHGAEIEQYVDGKTGLADRETNNQPEGDDVLMVAKQAKTQLEKDGYKVILSRNNDTRKITKRERVTAATNAGANIAVSIHTTEGDEINEVWPQRVGTYREYNGTKVKFTNQETADKSEQYAQAFADARSESESRPVGIDKNNNTQSVSFSREGVPSKGNISLIQLWSQNIPWVYSEFARGAENGLSGKEKQTYATGIVNGVKKSLGDTTPTTPITDECGQTAFGGGDLPETTLAYAWPTYHSPNYLDMMPGYQNAVKQAQLSSRYVGGGSKPGIDCGGFVTTLLVDSGFEPNYNHGGKTADGAGNTPIQEAWTQSNWKTLGSGNSIDPATLQPGDVAFSPGHTFVYVGDIDGFESKIASASYSPSGTKWRSPMAGTESLTASDVTWYRKNGS